MLYSFGESRRLNCKDFLTAFVPRRIGRRNEGEARHLTLNFFEFRNGRRFQLQNPVIRMGIHLRAVCEGAVRETRSLNPSKIEICNIECVLS